jgi:hypothetical protein
MDGEHRAVAYAALLLTPLSIAFYRANRLGLEECGLIACCHRSGTIKFLPSEDASELPLTRSVCVLVML